MTRQAPWHEDDPTGAAVAYAAAAIGIGLVLLAGIVALMCALP